MSNYLCNFQSCAVPANNLFLHYYGNNSHNQSKNNGREIKKDEESTIRYTIIALCNHHKKRCNTKENPNLIEINAIEDYEVVSVFREVGIEKEQVEVLLREGTREPKIEVEERLNQRLKGEFDLEPTNLDTTFSEISKVDLKNGFNFSIADRVRATIRSLIKRPKKDDYGSMM